MTGLRFLLPLDVMLKAAEDSSPIVVTLPRPNDKELARYRSWDAESPESDFLEIVKRTQAASLAKDPRGLKVFGIHPKDAGRIVIRWEGEEEKKK